MIRGVRRGICAAFAVGLVSLAAGCSSGGSNDEVTPGTTSPSAAAAGTPSASESAAPTPTPPVLSDAAKQPTREGAVAFVEYFWDAYNYGYAAQDPSYVQAISHEKCVFCKSTVDSITSGRRKRHTVTGGQVTLAEAVATPGDPAKGLVVNTIIDQGAWTVVSPGGTLVDRSPAEPNQRADAAVLWVKDRWIVRGIDVADPNEGGDT